MKNELKDLILNISKINRSCDLLCNIKEYEVDGETVNPFQEKWYKIGLDDNFNLEFCIIKETCVPACPTYLDICFCTDRKHLLWDMLSSESDTIDYGQLIFSYTFTGKRVQDGIELLGIFGEDFKLYEGLKVIRRIVPKVKDKYFNFDILENMNKEIEQL